MSGGGRVQRGRVTMMRRFCTGFLAAAVLFGAASAQAEMVLRIGNGSDPETLDPYRITSVTGAVVIRDLCEGLVAHDARGAVVPALAEDWTISEDGLTYTFTLRPDLKWGDGSPLTSADFVWSWRRSVAPATAPGFPELMYPIRNAQEIVAGKLPPEELGVAAPDARTVVVTLHRPFPDFLGFSAVTRHAVPVQRTAVEAHGDDFVKPGRFFCSGAFNLAEAVPQSHMKLVKNQHYWDAANVQADVVYYYSTAEAGTELKRFRAGELDATQTVPLQQTEWARENLPGALRISDYAGTYYYQPNLTREPWKSNVKLRLALAMAIDRQALVEKILRNGQKPAFTVVPPGLPGYDQPLPDWAGWTQDQRNARAREMLAEAGYGPGNPLKFELLYNTLESHKMIAIAVASMWKNVLGVEAVLNNQEWKVVLERQSAKTFPDLIRAGWISEYPYSHLELMRSTASNAGHGYNNPAFDALMAEADLKVDPEEFRAKLREAEALAMAEMPVITLYHYTRVRLVSPKLRGWEDNITDVHPAKYLWLEP